MKVVIGNAMHEFLNVTKYCSKNKNVLILKIPKYLVSCFLVILLQISKISRGMSFKYHNFYSDPSCNAVQLHAVSIHIENGSSTRFSL